MRTESTKYKTKIQNTEYIQNIHNEMGKRYGIILLPNEVKNQFRLHRGCVALHLDRVCFNTRLGDQIICREPYNDYSSQSSTEPATHFNT